MMWWTSVSDFLMKTRIWGTYCSSPCTYNIWRDLHCRCVSQREQQGGNAANSSYVLGLLNSSCEFLGTIGKGPRSEYVHAMLGLVDILNVFVCSFLLNRLDGVGVAHHHCVCYPGKTVPNSNIMLSLATGSRTVVHYRYSYIERASNWASFIGISMFHFMCVLNCFFLICACAFALQCKKWCECKWEFILGHIIYRFLIPVCTTVSHTTSRYFCTTIGWMQLSSTL